MIQEIKKTTQDFRNCNTEACPTVSEMFPNLIATQAEYFTAQSNTTQCFECHSYGGPDDILFMNKCIYPSEDTEWDLGNRKAIRSNS